MTNPESASAEPATQTVEFEGKKYSLKPLDTFDYGTIEGYLLAKRPNVLLIVAEAMQYLPESMRDQAWRDALTEARSPASIPFEDILRWIMGSIEGITYALLLRLEKSYPQEFDIKRAGRLAQHMIGTAFVKPSVAATSEGWSASDHSGADERNLPATAGVVGGTPIMT